MIADREGSRGHDLTELLEGGQVGSDANVSSEEEDEDLELLLNRRFDNTYASSSRPVSSRHAPGTTRSSPSHSPHPPSPPSPSSPSSPHRRHGGYLPARSPTSTMSSPTRSAGVASPLSPIPPAPPPGELIFDGDFEGGNVAVANRVSPVEWEVWVRPDSNRYVVKN